jgi:hypothetical protein
MNARLIALAAALLLTLCGVVAVFALARADRDSIRDERDAAQRAAVNLWNIDFMQRSRQRQRLLEGCADTGFSSRCRIDALAQSPAMPPYPTYRTASSALSAAYDAKWEGRKLAWVAIALAIVAAGALAATASVFVTRRPSQVS